MQIVNLRHPGYDDKVNVLLTLQAPDDPNGGIHHQTARLACCILAGNRWEGFLSITQENPTPVSPQERILRRKDYYFFLPDCIEGAQDAPEKKQIVDKKKTFSFGKKSREIPAPAPGQPKKSTKYPVTARFEDWEFPTGDLPPLWDSVEDVYRTGPKKDKKGRKASLQEDSEIRFVTSERCRLCGKKEETEEVAIWPKEARWLFRMKASGCVIYRELFNPEAEESEEEPKSHDKFRDDRNNLFLGIDCEGEDEHGDMIDAYKSAQFVFVPKFEDKGPPKMTIHRFGTVEDGVNSLHNKSLLQPEAASIELLFARFAWACFKQLGPFLKAGVQRVLFVENHDFDIVTRELSSKKCELFVEDRIKFWKDNKPLLESEPEVYKSSLQEAFDSENKKASQKHQVVGGKRMVNKYDFKLRHDAKCSICKQTIYGNRWHCLQCETSFDCCEQCFGMRKLNSWKHALLKHDFIEIHWAAFLERYKTDELVPEEEVESDEDEIYELAQEMNLEDEEPEYGPVEKFVNAKATYKRPIVYYSLPASTEDMKWVRILTLWPGKDFEPIMAHIEISELSNTPTFEALSYTWGDPDANASINVSGASLLVTHNLKVALSYLRHPRRPRRLWIDAICINQDDLDERAKQVMLMRDIYRRAYRTIIWLGDDDKDDAARAFQICQDIWKHHGKKFFDDNLKHLKTETSPFENVTKTYKLLDKRVRTVAKTRLSQNGKAKTHTNIDEYIEENKVELFRMREEWFDVYLRTGSLPSMQLDNIDMDDDVSSMEDPTEQNVDDENGEGNDEDEDVSDDSSDHSNISIASEAWSEDDMYERVNLLINFEEAEGAKRDVIAEPQLPTSQEIELLRNLFDRPWFSRVWIIQEAGMARNAIFQCASVTVDWFVLGFGYGLMIDLFQGSAFTLDYDRPVFNMSATRDMLARARKFGETLKELQLPFLLRRYRSSDATDSHDKVYALLGISQTDLQKYDFVPDYTREVVDTYKLVAVHLFTEYKNLDLLSVHRVPNAGGTDELPSWVPNWDDTTRQPWPLLTSLSSDAEMLILDVMNQRVFAAAKDSKLSTPLSIDEQKQRLTLHGYAICTIAQLAEPIFFEERNIDFLTRLSEALTSNSVTEMAEAVREMEEGLKFILTLREWEKIAGVSSSNNSDRHSVSSEFKAYVNMLVTEIDISQQETDPVTQYLLLYRTGTAILNALQASPIAQINKKISKAEDPQALKASAKQALDALEDKISDLLPDGGKSFAKAVGYMSFIYSRRLFRSSEGKFGLATTFAKRGDQIFLLEGGNVPLALRPANRPDAPNDAGLEVVGECYLTGAMHGEKWDVSRCANVVLV